LASAPTPVGDLVATNHRLLMPDTDGTRAIGWENIERATWSGESEQLIVVETAPMGERPRRHRVQVREPSRAWVLDVLRERVNASVVVSRHVPIVGAEGIRVNGRRRPATGELTWVVAVDAGVDIDDPAVRSRVDAAIAHVRVELE
jgi:hypothetical protein